MVCHTTLLKRVKRAKMVNARIGVSMTAADAEGIEELKKENIVLPVHNKRGIRCVWMFTKQDEDISHDGAFRAKGTHTCLIMQSKNRGNDKRPSIKRNEAEKTHAHQ